MWGQGASSMVTRFFCHCVLLMKAYSLRGNEWALSQLACLPLTQIPKNVGSSNGRRPDQIELNIRRRASCTGSKSDWENQRRHVAAFKTGMTWHLGGNSYLLRGLGSVPPRLICFCWLPKIWLLYLTQSPASVADNMPAFKIKVKWGKEVFSDVEVILKFWGNFCVFSYLDFQGQHRWGAHGVQGSAYGSYWCAGNFFVIFF